MDATSLVLLTALLVAGYACARAGLFAEHAAETLNRYVIYVSLPALVLLLIPKLHFQPDLQWLVLTPWLLLVVGVLIVQAGARVFGFSREVTAVLLLCVPLGNTSFLGFAMLSSLLGPDALRFAVLFDQLGSFLIVSTYGLFVLARFEGSQSPSLGRMAGRVLKFPPFLALMAALLLTAVGTRYPPPLTALLSRLGDTLVPLALFAVGLKLQLRPPGQWRALLFGLVTKMLILPAVAFAWMRVTGSSGLMARVAVLEAGMPPMMTAGALAMMAGLAPELAAALVGYGIVLALFTVPALSGLWP